MQKRNNSNDENLNINHEYVMYVFYIINSFGYLVVL